jgi:hypothetical protein
MIEADVWRSIIAVLRTGLDNQNLNDVTIHQAYQPIKQGPDSSRSIYLHKITSQRVGHQGRKYNFNPGDDDFDEVEKYWLSVTIQLMPLVSQDITDENSITAFDVIDLCAAILQTRQARKTLLDSGISIEKIGQITVGFSIDDKDQFDLDPSFDFILLYEQTLSSKAPKVNTFDADIKRV